VFDSIRCQRNSPELNAREVAKNGISTRNYCLAMGHTAPGGLTFSYELNF